MAKIYVDTNVMNQAVTKGGSLSFIKYLAGETDLRIARATLDELKGPYRAYFDEVEREAQRHGQKVQVVDYDFFRKAGLCANYLVFLNMAKIMPRDIDLTYLLAHFNTGDHDLATRRTMELVDRKIKSQIAYEEMLMKQMLPELTGEVDLEKIERPLRRMLEPIKTGARLVRQYYKKYLKHMRGGEPNSVDEQMVASALLEHFYTGEDIFLISGDMDVGAILKQFKDNLLEERAKVSAINMMCEMSPKYLEALLDGKCVRFTIDGFDNLYHQSFVDMDQHQANVYLSTSSPVISEFHERMLGEKDLDLDTFFAIGRALIAERLHVNFPAFWHVSFHKDAPSLACHFFPDALREFALGFYNWYSCGEERDVFPYFIKEHIPFKDPKDIAKERTRIFDVWQKGHDFDCSKCGEIELEGVLKATSNFKSNG